MSDKKSSSDSYPSLSNPAIVTNHFQWKNFLDKILSRKGEPHSVEHLAVSSPPCVNCKHWKPSLQFDGQGNPEALFCRAEEQFQDFSCRFVLGVEVEVMGNVYKD